MRSHQAALLSFVALVASVRPAQSSTFRVSVIDGEGALNNVQAKVAHDPVVRVADADGKPLAGARVEFDSPTSGPGVRFGNGSTHYATATNGDGIAAANGEMSNGAAGAFTILVHVSYLGQSIGEAAIGQTNFLRKVASASNDVHDTQEPKTSQTGATEAPSDVLGIATGDQFLVNGASTPSNANLLKGTRLQSGATPVTVYLHDHCEFLVGPHSTVLLNQPRLLTIESGAVRAKHFGNCKMGYGGLWASGVGDDADGVMSVQGDSMEVASVSGNLQVVNTAGDVVGNVAPGSVSTFGSTAAASGASTGAGGLSTRDVWLLGAGLGAGLAGLGLAVDAILQPSTATASPTSP
jgi:hypothetical protein